MNIERSKEPKILPKEIAGLIARIEALEKVTGIKGVWVSPSEAEPFLGISLSMIKLLIKKTESLRMQGQPVHYVFGVHYRYVRTNPDSDFTWQVNYLEFEKVLNTPEEFRKSFSLSAASFQKL